MESLHYLLMKAHTQLNRSIMARASRQGLTPGQPKILEFLLAHGEAEQKAIAAHCEIEPATVGSILLRMENAGLISRRQREGNRRSLYVSLTASGRQAARTMAQIFQEEDARAAASLSPEELGQLKALLSRLDSSVSPSEARHE